MKKTETLYTEETGSESSVLLYRADFDPDTLKPAATVVVTDGFVGYLIKDGKIDTQLQPGKYAIFDKKDDLAGLFHNKKLIDRFSVVMVRRGIRQKLLWGTPLNAIVSYDKESNFPFSVRGNGECEIEISDPRLLLKIAGNVNQYAKADLEDYVRSFLVANIREIMLDTIENKNLDVLDLGGEIDVIGKEVSERLGKVMPERYGITLVSFIINSMDIDSDSKQRIKMYRDKEKERAEKEHGEERAWAREDTVRAYVRQEKRDYFETVKEAGWQPNDPEPAPPPQEETGSTVAVHESAAESETIPEAPQETEPPETSEKNKEHERLVLRQFIAPSGAMCPKCGAKATGAYCTCCGAKIAKICERCGKISIGEEFCDNCGTRLT